VDLERLNGRASKGPQGPDRGLLTNTKKQIKRTVMSIKGELVNCRRSFAMH